MGTNAWGSFYLVLKSESHIQSRAIEKLSSIFLSLLQESVDIFGPEDIWLPREDESESRMHVFKAKPSLSVEFKKKVRVQNSNRL